MHKFSIRFHYWMRHFLIFRKGCLFFFILRTRRIVTKLLDSRSGPFNMWAIDSTTLWTVRIHQDNHIENMKFFFFFLLYFELNSDFYGSFHQFTRTHKYIHANTQIISYFLIFSSAKRQTADSDQYTIDSDIVWLKLHSMRMITKRREVKQNRMKKKKKKRKISPNLFILLFNVNAVPRCSQLHHIVETISQRMYVLAHTHTHTHILAKWHAHFYFVAIAFKWCGDKQRKTIYRIEPEQLTLHSTFPQKSYSDSCLLYAATSTAAATTNYN